MAAEIALKTTGVRGTSPKFENKGKVVIFPDKDSGNYISADAFSGQGASYQRMENVIIEIREDREILFMGSFIELCERLK